VKKALKVSLMVVGIILLLAFFYPFGFLSFLNAPLNSILYGPIDRSCTIDSDCVLQTTCEFSCGCPLAVNKNWDTICPFGYKHFFALCEPCLSLSRSELKCINNQCQQVFIHS